MAGPGELFVVGVSWRTAAVAIREKLAFADHELEGALSELVSCPEVAEAVLLSTCNRVELYGATGPAEGDRDPTTSAAAIARSFLARSRGVDVEAITEHLYERVGDDAVRHLFQVASAVDSMVIGESQILGQLKDAYGVAAKSGTTGLLLGRSMDKAFQVGKRVRTETAISRGAANVSTVAVDLVRHVFGDLDGKRVLLVGAGKMSALAGRHLRSSGASALTVVNRSPEKAEALAAEVEGTARSWDELDLLLTEADVVISSTGSVEPIFTPKNIKAAMKARRRRALVVIDIAVPRDADPRIGKRDGVYLFDIDDLERVVSENLIERRKEADAAMEIIDEEVQDFRRWLQSQRVVPTIRSLREHFHRIAQIEAERCISGLEGASPEQVQRAIRRMSQLVANKLLHTPLSALKSGDDIENLVDAAQKLFSLVEKEEKARKQSESEATVAELPDDGLEQKRGSG